MTQLGAALARLRYQFPQRAADLAGVQEPQDTAGQNERRGMCDAALVRHAQNFYTIASIRSYEG